MSDALTVHEISGIVEEFAEAGYIDVDECGNWKLTREGEINLGGGQDEVDCFNKILLDWSERIKNA